MEIAKINFIAPLSTKITHLHSKTSTHTDAPKDNNGEGKYLSPTDMVATSLGSCIMTVIGIYCIKNKLNLIKLECSVGKKMKNAPRRIGAIIIVIDIKISKLNHQDKVKIETVGKNCPVALSLSEELKQEISFNWD